MVPNPLQWEGLNLEAPKAMHGDHTSRNRLQWEGFLLHGEGLFAARKGGRHKCIDTDKY